MEKRKLFIVKLIVLFCLTTNITIGQTLIKNNEVKINYTDSILIFNFTKKKVKKLKIDQEYFWFNNQKIQSTTYGYSGYLLHGEYKVFHVNGQLKVDGEFKNGVRDELWKFWDENGALIKVTKFPIKEESFLSRLKKKRLKKKRKEKRKKKDAEIIVPKENTSVKDKDENEF